MKCNGDRSELGLNPPPVPRQATNGLGLMVSAMVAGLGMVGGFKTIGMRIVGWWQHAQLASKYSSGSILDRS